MLSQELLEQIKTYTMKMAKPVKIRLSMGNNDSKEELSDMLEKMCSTSDLLSLDKDSVQLRSGVSFDLLSEGKETGISFSGIPGGHEFNSFLLAILQSGGVPLKLDEGIQKMIRGINKPLKFETIVSLSCHNCPDVVQAFNQLCLLNENISHEMIEGGLFPELIEERKILGVPAVYLNGELFSNGKMEISDIIEKLQDSIPKVESSDSANLETYDVVVIGGGPAGVSSAIYTARKGLKVMVIADRVGGQVKDTMDIENMISMVHTTGPKLTQSLEDHLQKYNILIRKNLKVDSIEDGELKKIHLSTKDTILTKTIIIATGAKWRELGVPGEKENIGSGVAYCPHCDGPFFKNKDVVVVGGGNSGIEAALDLSGIVNTVTVIEYSSELKADQILVERALGKSNIKIRKSITSQSIEAENGKVQGMNIFDREKNISEFYRTDGVFIQIGLIPNSSFTGSLLDKTKSGEIIVDAHCKTNIKGIFACGDVTNTPFKQIIIAMGEGAKAGLSAFESIAMGR